MKLLYCFVTFPLLSQLRQVASVPLIFNGITTTFSKILFFIQFIVSIYYLFTRLLSWFAIQLLSIPPPLLLACHKLFWFTIPSGAFLSIFWNMSTRHAKGPCFCLAFLPQMVGWVNSSPVFFAFLITTVLLFSFVIPLINLQDHICSNRLIFIITLFQALFENFLTRLTSQWFWMNFLDCHGKTVWGTELSKIKALVSICCVAERLHFFLCLFSWLLLEITGRTKSFIKMDKFRLLRPNCAQLPPTVPQCGEETQSGEGNDNFWTKLD